MRIPALVCAAVILASAVLVADDHSVIFDEDVDFSAFRTFDVRDARMSSARPELTFPAVMKAIDESVRGAMTAKGLKPMTDHPDLVVEYRVAGVDYSIGPFGRPKSVDFTGLKETADHPDLLVDYTVTGEDFSIGVPTPMRGDGPQPVRSTAGTLVIDLTKPGDPSPVWRGKYSDEEGTGSKLVQKLPEDAKKLVARYPQHTK